MRERTFHVKKRMVLICDFDAVGFKQPEMTKRRRVVVLRVFGPIALIVPLSATEPHRIQRHHVHIFALPYASLTADVWAKCSMLTHVSVDRLNRVRLRGRELTEQLRFDDFRRVLVGAAFAIGAHDTNSD
jgi:uncharacterized protein YifN (PemK superfamily)